MFNFFKKKKKEKPLPPLSDLENRPLQVGDKVISHRYDLGECLIKEEEGKVIYVSIGSGEKVSWIKMIDAATENQKVTKIVEDKVDTNEPGSTPGN